MKSRSVMLKSKTCSELLLIDFEMCVFFIKPICNLFHSHATGRQLLVPVKDAFWLQLIQDRQCTYNVTLWRVRVTSFALEKQQCICVFPHYFINGTIFGKKKVLNIKCVLIFSTTLVWNISHSKENSERSYRKSSCKGSIIFVRF
jgi:hypothetical protein